MKALTVFGTRPEAIKLAPVVKELKRRSSVDSKTIINETFRLPDDKNAYEAMAHAVNPFGDGYAAGRVVDALLKNMRL
jgi:UDP-N-acetylglucosamine 2-epimerase (non-hydrolysing)